MPRRGAGAGRDHTLVFRAGESSSITVVDHRGKSFSVIDRASMTAFGTEMRMMLQATAMRIESLPPEQQALARQVLKSQLGIGGDKAVPTPSTVIRTSDRETVNGLPCVKYEVFQGGEKLRETWVAPPDAVRGGEPVLSLLREMSDFYGSLIDTFGKIVPGVGSGLDRTPFEDLRRMQGFPVLTRNFAGGRVETEIALLSIAEQRLPAAEFEPPQGYTAVVTGASEPNQ